MHYSLKNPFSIFSSVKQNFVGKVLLLKIPQQTEHNFKDNFLIIYPPIYEII